MGEDIHQLEEEANKKKSFLQEQLEILDQLMREVEALAS